MKYLPSCVSGAAVVLLLFLATGSTALAAAPEMNLKAQLVWGTDGGKPKDQTLKDLDQKTKERLKKVFKWKDYFEVDQQGFKVATASKKRVRMSSKCEIEVENLGSSTVEVKLYGEGKMVVRRKEALPEGELLVMAGEDKNDTAWFVVLSVAKK